MAYAFRQHGSTSIAPLEVRVLNNGVPGERLQQITDATSPTYGYDDNNNDLPGLTMSYYVRGPNREVGSDSVDYDEYKAKLAGGGSGYMKIVAPKTTGSTTLVLTASDLPNDEMLPLRVIDEVPRVQTGDYVWLEIEPQEYTTADGWVDATPASGTDYARRVCVSVNLTHDGSVPESSVY